jgi:hypothetical protein
LGEYGDDIININSSLLFSRAPRFAVSSSSSSFVISGGERRR